MITQELEYFTARQAVDDGLCAAILRGEAKLQGTYECGAGGKVVFKQQSFVFTDRIGQLRVGKFVDDDAVASLMNFFRTGEF